VLEFTWQRKCLNGYEVSSKGDKRFSAFYAIMPDGMSIEHHYQVGVKGYPSIKEGKGKPPISQKAPEELYEDYLSLWEQWAQNNIPLMRELYKACRDKGTTTLTDMFATTPVNQAHALADVLNKLIRGKE
jgi:hypothetical protein